MRHISTIFLLIFFIYIGVVSPVFCAIKGGINYSIPVYYDNLSEDELSEKVKIYYYNAMKLDNGVVDENMTLALNIYTILQNMNPENIDYSTFSGSPRAMVAFCFFTVSFSAIPEPSPSW